MLSLSFYSDFSCPSLIRLLILLFQLYDYVYMYYVCMYYEAISEVILSSFVEMM